jgi:hypothetical protein
MNKEYSQAVDDDDMSNCVCNNVTIYRRMDGRHVIDVGLWDDLTSTQARHMAGRLLVAADHIDGLNNVITNCQRKL